MSRFDPATGMVDGSIMPMTYFRADSLSLTDGTAVGSPVPDRAGNNWLQVTGSLQPLFKTNIFGSLPSVRFDGTDDFMLQSAAGTTNRGTVFLLFSPTSTVTTASALQQPLAFVSNGSGVNVGIEFGAATGSLANEIVSIQSPSANYSAWSQSGATIPTGTNLLTVRWNTGTSKYDIYYNGGANQNNASAGSQAISSSNFLMMGAGRSNQTFFPGDFGVILVYAAVLTDAQKAAVHSYLQDVWGATAADYDANWASSIRRPTYHLNGQLVEIPDGDTFPAVGGVVPVDVQAFVSTGTWTKPTGVTLVKAICIGAGGGGGTGRRGVTASNKGGGAGGGGGAYSMATFPASVLSSTEAVTVGAAGTAGTAVATDDTDGNSGGNGGDSVFRASNGCTGGGGGGGTGGTTAAAGTGGLAGAGHYAGGAGANGGAPAAGNGGSATTLSGLAGTGGGGGAGNNNSARAGGAGGANNGSGLAGGTGGSNGGSAAGVGASGPASQPYTGTGGGGGGCQASGTGGVGGAAGGGYGGGGGGASASHNTFAANTGGAGANGFVIVYSY